MNPFGCFHCEEDDHWADDCPLLVPPADRTAHLARIKRAVERFLNLEIGQVTKKRIIEKENTLWKEKQKEMTKK